MTASSDLVAILLNSIAPFDGMDGRAVAALTTIDQVHQAAATILALEADKAALVEALADCASELNSEIEARRRTGELPRRIESDLDTVRHARAILAKHGDDK